MGIIRIKPDGRQVYAAPYRRNADIESFVFCRNGEFSASSDIYFEKHLAKVYKIAHRPEIRRLNGTKLKVVNSYERFWYK
jgi:hypothetical protein